MKAYVITLRNNAYSRFSSLRCIISARRHDLRVRRFYGVDKYHAKNVMREHGLKWTWAKNNTETVKDPVTKLRQHPYGKLEPKIGCAMSHYLLWQRCTELQEPILILEHDAVFMRPLPDVQFNGICQINDPRGATPHGAAWSDSMAKRGDGIWPKTLVMPRGQPDGLAGNSAYMLTPWAAAELMAAFKEYGVWPNDATMCIQLFPYLQELYPFVTMVRQTVSTTTI